MTKAWLVAGLAFGDEGKGSIVDHLARTTGANLVVRYNGGPQCGHNVVTSDGRHHCFAQFGSGSFAGAASYLSRFMLVDPYALQNERECLLSKLDKLPSLYVEEGCPIITPFHWMSNRLREQARGVGRHGSCGMGVGELRSDQIDNQPVITVADLTPWKQQEVYWKLLAIRELKSEQLRRDGIDPSPLMGESLFSIGYFYERFSRLATVVPNDSLRSLISGPVVFEGAQGMLLDEHFGIEPHRTWTDITYRNALRLLEGSNLSPFKIGVLRTYFTRHGAGPFPTEDPAMQFPDHNTQNDWQGSFRQGHFDMEAARYAVRSIGGVDGIALTHLDQVEAPAKLEELLGAPIVIESHGPTAEDKACCLEEAMCLG